MGLWMVVGEVCRGAVELSTGVDPNGQHVRVRSYGI